MNLMVDSFVPTSEIHLNKLMAQALFWRTQVLTRSPMMTKVEEISHSLKSVEEILTLCYFFHGEQNWDNFIQYFTEENISLSELCFQIFLTGKLYRYRNNSDKEFETLCTNLVNFIKLHCNILKQQSCLEEVAPGKLHLPVKRYPFKTVVRKEEESLLEKKNNS